MSFAHVPLSDPNVTVSDDFSGTNYNTLTPLSVMSSFKTDSSLTSFSLVMHSHN